MACEHRRLISVNGEVRCMDCGVILPQEILTKKPEAPAKPTKPRKKKKTDD